MKHHNPRFLAVVDAARARVQELTVSDVMGLQEAGVDFDLVDVREDREWDDSHIVGALHIGKGVLERDIEKLIPDPDRKIVLYCGGGYRSALAAEALGQMGYTDVASMDGGFRDWRERGLPVTSDQSNAQVRGALSRGTTDRK